MKKLVIVLLALVLLSPNAVKAQTVTNEQLLAQINSLMQIVMSLMEQLKNVEAKQNTIVQNTTPVVQQSTGTISEPILGVATTTVANPTILMQDAYSVKITSCTPIKAKWTDIFAANKSWFNAPERTASEKDGYYEAYQLIDSKIFANFESQFQGRGLNSNYCPNDPAKKAGCEIVLKAQQDFIQCVLSQ